MNMTAIGAGLCCGFAIGAGWAFDHGMIGLSFAFASCAVVSLVMVPLSGDSL